MKTLVRLLSLVGLGVVTSAGCSSTRDDPPEPLPVIACASSEIAVAMDPATDVRVFVDPDLHPQVSADLGSYLTRMWKRQVSVVAGAPEGAGDAVWISSSPAALEKARPPEGGYALVRADEGPRKLLLAASAPADRAFAAYALLEELGARFFHPMQELVPELDGPRFPRALEARRTPMTKTARGLQPHLLHPTEYMRTFQEPGEANLAEARRFVDWLVKTGQNHVQWPLLDENATPWVPFSEHARQIAAYARSRGVTTGAVIQVNQRGSLQRNYVLVKDEAKKKEQIEAALTKAMEVPWNDVELALGEFLATDPEGMLESLNLAVAHLAKIAPETRVGVHNHVGNFPDLYVDFRGQTTFFYHVPQYADPRLGQTVHTVFWYDLYRDRGMYSHPNFFLQRDYIMAQLATTGRRVRYYPESAYWIAADVDVPVFLPEFIESRWLDIHRLDEDIRNANLPKLDGHLLFTSGHEWGYWLTDYLVAKMLWEPAAPLDRFLQHYAAAFGSCSGGVAAELSAFIALQKKYLFEGRLIPYVSGEDATVETGASVGYVIRDIRKKFEDLVTGPESERAAFEAEVLAPLETMTAETRPIEDSLAARCRGSDPILAPWCDELRDGVRIVRQRLEHVVVVYRAVIAHARGDGTKAKELLARARAKTEEAKVTIEAREKAYRFDLERLTGAYYNPTFYPFGYLRQAHTQCLWRRRDQFASLIIEEGVLGSTSDVPTCLD
ncbi:MAG: hypothetical protein KF819_04480 [Labilithrix sp.]|nr:hypothetical protein [Labilithrix sp.]